MAIKILVVEDDEIILRMYKRFFATADFLVETAVDGTEVQTKAKSFLPDIILMDVMMPRMNGIEALKVLKSDDTTKNMPVVILSAYEDDTLLQQALNLGANRYLLKSSMDQASILNIIKEVSGKEVTGVAPAV